MHARPRKAVIPAAGLGTRFLPATKAMPKEMLPVVDRPAIQYVVEEAAAAGLRDVLMITGRNKTTLENHFDRVAELETMLEDREQHEKLALVREATELADLHYLRQGAPLGLGHAVLRAKKHVGAEAFAVLLGDDLIVDDGVLLRRMLDVHERTGSSVVALGEVPRERVNSYGVVAYEPGDEPDLVRVTRLVEKPDPADAPSNLVILGRYVLRPEVFDVLERTGPGRGGEIQLTDALSELAASSDAGGVIGVVHSGRRFDTGNRLDYAKAVIELALANEELGPALRAWLPGFVAGLEAGD
ncbi:UTP--glucose-1-phosphate uridylyltransferase GalU [Pseudoclavibacter chungangensis]|uniref:UTP--glucose-1-phosphate uridylyltransferase n=1 Tax=Pseudoclavibacter chungangensis TaxID=587635 RepID=A0A7J5C0Y7_9MICO|nr:UTP--glucose-1-phosphate uridylyltransferase GalU [Pseudoclavibacter chungangensis]KAB1660406.1 UTP--glucose-1-phosphate uridylyltransferase GalU [Pseudoclavibacter chungangensis]NYJ65772.1 UTP--glucose-1-phosphate uridylyltransferase [Pseudoclavibacter chungangensis]